MAQLPASKQSSAETCAQLDGGEGRGRFFQSSPRDKVPRGQGPAPREDSPAQGRGLQETFPGLTQKLLNHCWKITMSVLDMYRGSVCPRAASSPRQPLVSAT